jgi:hypothetical protein
VRLGRKKRLRYQWVAPYYTVGDQIKEFKSLLCERWYGIIQRHLSREQVAIMWAQLSEDIPFLRSTPEATLEASPYDFYSQLLGFIESTSGSMKIVKLLARGSTDLNLQSMDVLFRFNISPYHHFSSKYDESKLSLGEKDMLPIMTDVPAPVMSPRLLDQASRLEDRVKGWNEILYQAAEGQRKPLYDLFLMDIKTLVRDLPKPDVEQSSTGSSRLDSFLLRARLMCGEIDLIDFTKRAESFTIWEVPDVFIRGQGYDESGVVIRKRHGTIARMVSTETGGVITTTGEEFHAREMFRNRAITNIKYGVVPIYKLKCIGLVYVKGSRMMHLYSKEMKVNWYMSPPDARASSYHMKKSPTVSDEADLLECWVSRSAPTETAYYELIMRHDDQTAKGEVARSVAKYCKRISKMSPTYRVAERIELAESRVTEDDDPNELIRSLGVNLMELGLDESPEYLDMGDYFHSTDVHDMLAGVQGLEAFAAEFQYTSWELNPCLRDLTSWLANIKKTPKSLQTEPVKKFVVWFDSLR